MIAVLISFFVGALTVYALFSCCVGKQRNEVPASTGAPSRSPMKSPKKDVKTKAISPQADHLRVMLGIPEGSSLCISVNMASLFSTSTPT